MREHVSYEERLGELGVFSLGKPQSPFHGLKGLLESWRGTLDQGLKCYHKGKWLPTARGQG